MRIEGLHRNFYKLANYALSMQIKDQRVYLRQKILGDWELLKRKGLRDYQIASITCISRSTFYRRKKAVKLYGIKGLSGRSKRPKNFRSSVFAPSWTTLILNIRLAHPTYGKAKIHRILQRDHGYKYSESTVGRILKKLMNKGKIAKYLPSQKSRRRRKFDKYAQRWRYGMKASKMGELIQIDHMSVNKNGIGIKHFQAWDPVSKTIVAEVYSNASSRSASAFLKKLRNSLNFKILSIQVDGGSEFMADFEQTCKTWGIPLFVLPPRKPQWNGGVERGNRTLREDFYESPDFIPDSIAGVRHQLHDALSIYNTYRPHMALCGITPHEYVINHLMRSPQSHML
jgi:transposase InsO family protein